MAKKRAATKRAATKRAATKKAASRKAPSTEGREVTPNDRRIAQIAARAFGAPDWTVRRYWDDAQVTSVDVLFAPDSPLEGVLVPDPVAGGVNAFATIGMSDTPLMMDGKEYKVRAELVAADSGRCKTFPNIVATAAFHVMRSGFFCFPGAILPDVVAQYRASRSMRHLLFVPPFPWERKLRTTKVGKKKVAWLMIVPISDRERDFADREGTDALEELLERAEADFLDIRRKSVV